ncbi:hypothetical protein [Thermoflexus sp.]|uniref:hypothetical protein n=1 Tax=Thermoflexus sp. TaxID=1969742 RepID=UPI0035E427CD
MEPATVGKMPVHSIRDNGQRRPAIGSHAAQGCLPRLFEQAQTQAPGRLTRWLVRLELARTRRLEAWWLSTFPRILVTSRKEAAVHHIEHQTVHRDLPGEPGAPKGLNMHHVPRLPEGRGEVRELEEPPCGSILGSTGRLLAIPRGELGIHRPAIFLGSGVRLPDRDQRGALLHYHVFLHPSEL